MPETRSASAMPPSIPGFPDGNESGAGRERDALELHLPEHGARLAVVGNLLSLRDLRQLAVVEDEEGDARLIRRRGDDRSE